MAGDNESVSALPKTPETQRSPTPKGQALTLSLLLLLVVAAVVALVLALVGNNARLQKSHWRRSQARLAASSAFDYAVHELNVGDWLQRSLPIRESGEGWWGNGRGQESAGRRQGTGADVEWQVRVEQPHNGQHKPPTLRVIAEASFRGERWKVARDVSDPRQLWRYVRNIHSYDWSSGEAAQGRIAEFGGHGASAEGLVSEVLRIPESRRLSPSAASDPAFAGVVAGTDAVMDEEGRWLQRVTVPTVAGHTAGSPALVSGQYALDANSGMLSFSAADAGKSVVVWYDYYHRVPRLPGPFTFALLFPIVRRDSDSVAGVAGLYYRDTARPRVQGHYSLEEEKGRLHFSEHDSNLPVRVRYAFEGSRMSGPVHVNGSVRWSGRNTLTLFASAGETVEVSGGYLYETGTSVHVLTAGLESGTPSGSGAPRGRTGEGRTLEIARPQEVDVTQQPSPVFLCNGPVHIPPQVGYHFYRQLADPGRGGDGLYFNNPAEVQDPRAAQLEWQGRTTQNWTGAIYSPPGAEVHLATVGPPNGVVFSEGNVKVRGSLPAGRKLTVVSGAILYVEGDGQPAGQDSELALIARDHVCVNASRWASAGDKTVYLNSLIYAQTGSFGVVPSPFGPGSRAARLRFVFCGSVNENAPYPNSEWARAFSSIEWTYDRRWRKPEARPHWLAGVVTSGG